MRGIKGEIQTIHNAITTDVLSASTEALDCKGFNSLLVYISGTSPALTLDIESSDSKDGSYFDTYDSTQATDKKLSSGALTAGRVILFKGIGDWVKAVPSGVSGTVTVKLQPINL